MKSIYLKVTATTICLLIGWSLCGCRAGPTKSNTYLAVNDYFELKAMPYSILFGTPQRWGPIKTWPIRVYPLYFQDGFQRSHSGNYFIFRNEVREWEIADETRMEKLAGESSR